MILVTGGNGMLGRAAVEQLLARGDAVRSFDLAAHPNPAVDSVVGDIRNLADLRLACTGVHGVIHTASLVDLHLGQPERLHEINVAGVEKLITACRENKVRRLVYMSSAEVISGASPLRNAGEDAPYPRPHLTYYGNTKEAAERLVIEANDGEFATCAFRTFGIFGEGDRNFVARAMALAPQNHVPLIGANRGLTNVAYSGNIAHALILGLSQMEIENPVSGQIFHVTDHEAESIQDFLIAILAPLGYRRLTWSIPFSAVMIMARLLSLPYRFTKAERFANPPLTRHQLLLATQDYYLDDRKARSLLGYTPQFERSVAMKRTRAWLVQQQQNNTF